MWRIWLGRFGAVTVFWAGVATAAPCPPGRSDCKPSATSPIEENERAVGEGRQGLALYQKGDWNDAYQHFAVADRIAHSPVFVLYMARARRNAGRFVDARGLFQRVIREQLPAGAPAPWTQAQGDARTELAALEPRIPRIRLVLVGARSAAPRAWLDGELVDRPLDQPLLVDPGTHTLKVDGAGQQRVDLRDGQAVSLEFRLHASAPPPPPPVPPAPHHAVSLPAWIAFGVGAAGIVTGAVTGGIAWSETNAIKQNCNGTHCLVSDAAAGSRASTFATVSDVAFIVGGVGAATGLGLVLFRGSSRHGDTALVVAPGRVLVRSRF